MIQLQPNANLWNQVWFVTIPKTLDPLPRQTCPLLFTSPVILTFLNFPSGFHTAKSGGQIIQKISTGLVVGGGQDAIVGFPKKCIIGEPQLHLFSIQATYSLSFDLYTYIADSGSFSGVGIHRRNKLMTTKELLEIIILVIGGGGGVAAGAFALAMNKYSVELLKHGNNLEKLQLDIKDQNFETARKIQKNIDHLTTEFGVVKCDVRDIKAVLMRQGIIDLLQKYFMIQ